MEMSIEKKIQELDRMIEIRNQLSELQDNLGAWNQVDKNSAVLIYSTEDFFEIAKYVKAEVSLQSTGKDSMTVCFDYKETTFKTFILYCEYQLHKDEIHTGDINV